MLASIWMKELTVITILRPPIVLCRANRTNRCWHLTIVLLAVLEVDPLPIEQLGDTDASPACAAARCAGAGAGAGAMVSIASGPVALGIHDVPHCMVPEKLTQDFGFSIVLGVGSIRRRAYEPSNDDGMSPV